jgi:mannose-6-phosphate isomerase-like protein (cupin superfamily)
MKVLSLTDLPFFEVSHNPAIKKKVMIENDELKNITNFSQAVVPVGEVADEHMHEDMAEVFWVVSGEGAILINGVTYKLFHGVCAMVEAGEMHEIQNTGDEELVIVYFGVLNP